MTETNPQPSSPRRATAEEVDTALNAWFEEIDGGESDRALEKTMTRALNAVFALPSTHDEAIRAEEREVVVTAPIMKAALEAWNDKIDLGLLAQLTAAVAAAFRARASSPRSVPAEGNAQAYRKAVDGLNRWKDTAAPAPVRATGEPDYRYAFAAQSRKLQAVLHVPGVREALAELEPLALPPGTVAPEGWVLVPIEPTEEMVVAGWIDKEDVDPDDIYAAMIAAAPSPPASETA